MTLRLASVALIACLLGVGPAWADESVEKAPSDRCGRVATLQAAKDALARGDREAALKHLRKADAMMEICVPQPEAAAPEKGGEAEDPAVAGMSFETHGVLPLS